MIKRICITLFFILHCFYALAQVPNRKPPIQSIDSIKPVTEEQVLVIEEAPRKKRINLDPLAPSKAAFYSAALPGLGQIYNRRYWKVPLVWGAIGTGTAIFIANNNQFNQFRDAFKRRGAGFTDDEFFERGVSDIALEDAQQQAQRNRDLSLAITLGLYLLNIIDANVDAHLKQFNVDDELGFDFKPFVDRNPITLQTNYGMGLKIKF